MNMKTPRLLLIALLGISSTSLAQQPSRPQPPLPDNIEVIRDVEYCRHGDKPLLLDIYQPKQKPESRMPAVVWIHGGGWSAGSKSGGGASALLAPRGYVAVSINYRLSQVAKFPAAIEDCKAAVRWLRANADRYHIDPDRIGVWGSSAGGHLSHLVGTSDKTAGLEGNGGNEKFSSRVQAVVSLCGPADLTLDTELLERIPNNPVVSFLGGTSKERPDAYKKASPIFHVTADDPPVMMFHGDRDVIVFLKQSEVMLKALKDAGVPAELIVVKNADHNFRQVGSNPIEPPQAELFRRAFEFFDKHLKKTDAPK